jgi:hypothetical protein
LTIENEICQGALSFNLSISETPSVQSGCPLTSSNVSNLSLRLLATGNNKDEIISNVVKTVEKLIGGLTK